MEIKEEVTKEEKDYKLPQVRKYDELAELMELFNIVSDYKMELINIINTANVPLPEDPQKRNLVTIIYETTVSTKLVFEKELNNIIYEPIFGSNAFKLNKTYLERLANIGWEFLTYSMFNELFTEYILSMDECLDNRIKEITSKIQEIHQSRSKEGA